MSGAHYTQPYTQDFNADSEMVSESVYSPGSPTGDAPAQMPYFSPNTLLNAWNVEFQDHHGHVGQSNMALQQMMSDVQSLISATNFMPASPNHTNALHGDQPDGHAEAPSHNEHLEEENSPHHEAEVPKRQKIRLRKELEPSFNKEKKRGNLAEWRRKKLIKIVEQATPPAWGFECIVVECKFVASHNGQSAADHVKEAHLHGFVCDCHGIAFSRRSNLTRSHILPDTQLRPGDTPKSEFIAPN